MDTVDFMAEIRTGNRPVYYAREFAFTILDDDASTAAYIMLSAVLVFVTRSGMAPWGREIAKVREIMEAGPTGLRAVANAMALSDLASGWVASEGLYLRKFSTDELWTPIRQIHGALSGDYAPRTSAS